jgi:hypothetical protein
MSNGLARPGTARQRAGTAQYLSCLNGPPGRSCRACPCFVLGLQPRHGPVGRFSCQAGPMSTTKCTCHASPCHASYNTSPNSAKFIDFKFHINSLKFTSDSQVQSQLTSLNSITFTSQLQILDFTSHNHSQVTSHNWEVRTESTDWELKRQNA